MASLASSLGLYIIPSLGTYKKVILSFKDLLALQIRSNKTDLRERSYEFGIRKRKTDEVT